MMLVVMMTMMTMMIKPPSNSEPLSDITNLALRALKRPKQAKSLSYFVIECEFHLAKSRHLVLDWN